MTWQAFCLFISSGDLFCLNTEDLAISKAHFLLVSSLYIYMP